MTPPPTLQELIETVRQDSSSDQPLDQLVAAAAAAAQLEETTDALLGYFVDRCRRDGRSWTEISAALGVTKQAVHKRFASAVATHIVAATQAPTFERFTDRARHVMAESSQAAISLGDAFVGTEHVLLALFTEPAGIAGRTLAAMDVSEDAVRGAIRAAGDRAPGTAEPSGQGVPSVPAGDAALAAAGAALAAAGAAGTPDAGTTPPFSGPAKRVLRDALAVALELGHNYIGTEHLLLALYRNSDSLAAQILTQAGASESTARAHVEDMLRGYRQGQ
ncbi:MAG TPA: Clp protease N-terminal domain-containing protein [Streptosporangiaceae bacterium]|nr:Clp protease N-terminal domain-containing protein [Streptosporangiaceae bacterium]